MIEQVSRSLWEPLDREGGRADLLRVWNGDSYTSWSWAEWRVRSLRVTAGLQELGVRPSDRVACLLTNTAEVCAGVLGVWLAGACLLSLPLIARGMEPAAYVEQLRRIVAQAEPTIILCECALVDLLEAAELGVRLAAFDDVGIDSEADPVLVGDGDPLFVQYSSGSTTEPKGCVLSAGAIVRQLAALACALEIDPEVDTGVVWLPLSHDMGLFGCLLLTYWTGHRLVLGTPQRFLTQPATWFEDCASFGATVSATASFALDLAARIAAARLPGPIPMRRMVIGGERVEPHTLRRACAAFGDERLPWSSLLPAYGLAEAVLAVTMTPVEWGPTILDLDLDALASGEVVAARPGGPSVSLTSAGRPLRGAEVAISGDGVGEITVSGSTLADGYLEQPELTAERFTPDGLLTGDLGFMHNGQLFVSGRVDDLMLVAGRNVYARDVEVALHEVAGVRPGSCAVVDTDNDGTSRIVALVELRPGHPDFSLMAEQIAASAKASTGVRVDECVFLPRGSLPKTPSGKVQRFRCRELATDGSYTQLVRVAL